MTTLSSYAWNREGRHSSIFELNKRFGFTKFVIVVPSVAIKVYAKLPGWFKVPTPLGSYNPDWAVLVEEDGAERLYFVVETKGGLFTDDLRDKESAKIECGKAHFKALSETAEEPGARYIVARTAEQLIAQAGDLA